MIFVTLGSQKFQFDRLLIELDKCIENNTIKDKIIAQIGYSSYEPKNYQFTKFLDNKEFENKINESSLIITHGGTGAIINSLKKDKKVIAVPRLSKYKEHVDDHQVQIVKEFSKMNIIADCQDVNKINEVISKIDSMQFSKYISNTERIIEDINIFLTSL